MSGNVGENKKEKHESSNAQRLAALRQRRLEKSAQLKQISSALKCSPRKNKIVFDDNIGDVPNSSVHTDKPTQTQNVCLFDSEESESDDEEDISFNIQHQFKGEKGQKLLELNAAMPDERYKCDLRFRQSDEENSDSSEKEDKDEDNKKYAVLKKTNGDDSIDEREKNLEILEQVLNKKIAPKPPIETKKRKYVRFDPESETASEFIRDERRKETVSAAPKKKKKKLKETEAKPEPVVSKQRYFQVATDLKTVLEAPKEPFSLSHKFNFQSKDCESEERTPVEVARPVPQKQTVNKIIGSQRTTSLSQQKGTFFVAPDDQRLKLGVEFFRRTEPIGETKERWLSARENVKEMLKRNRKVALKVVEQKVSQKQKFARNNRYGKK